MTEYPTTPTGKNMDLSFLQKPHEWDPRRTYSTPTPISGAIDPADVYYDPSGAGDDRQAPSRRRF